VTDKEGNTLWTVTVFRSIAESFIQKARNVSKIYVRQFDYDEKSCLEERKKRGELAEKIKTVETDLKKSCEIVYSALFECLMHLKILKSHVECVLRWSVPPKYSLCVVQVSCYC
jgi:hypothetical protein